MESKTIMVLDPTVKPKHKSISIARRLMDLNGKAVGILWNEKPNGDILLNRIKEKLSQKYNPSEIIWRAKDTASRPANSATLNDLASRADMVINAIAD